MAVVLLAIILCDRRTQLCGSLFCHNRLKEALKEIEIFFAPVVLPVRVGGRESLFRSDQVRTLDRPPA